MTIRVDSCRCTLVLCADFCGYTGIDLVLPQPIDADDPLIVMILERNRQVAVDQARAAAATVGLGLPDPFS